MFFVEKKNKNSKNPVLQLVKSSRKSGNPRQEIVISLGADFPVPKELRKEVAQAITEKLSGQEFLFTKPEVNQYAENIIRRIQQKGETIHIKKRNTKKDIREVFIDQIVHTSDRIAGPIVIGNSFWNNLHLDEILKEAGFSKQHLNVAKISILNRLISQDCEYAIPSWTKVYAAGDLIDKKAENLGKDIFYKISDKLLSRKSIIEKHLYSNIESFFNLNHSIFLYDLTNSYFEGTCAENPKAEFNGNQKEKRTDCRQIVIALLLDGEGFVKFHKVFNGKMSDAKSFKKILATLVAEYDSNDEVPTFIFDRGITSEENLALIKNRGFKYVVASRNNLENKYLSDYIHQDFQTIKDEKNNKVDVFLKKEEEEHYLLCKSSGRARKEGAMRTKKEQKMISDLQKLKTQVFSKQKIDHDHISQKIGRIVEKYASVSKFYHISYSPFSFEFTVVGKDKVDKRLINILINRKAKVDAQAISFKNLKSDLTEISEKYKESFPQIEVILTEPIFVWQTNDEKLDAELNLEGNYLLRTNRDDLSEETFWNVYTMLTRVEHAFRHLKTDLGLRPNYHHLESRVDGHVFISILAYQILQSIEYRLRQKGCSLSWSSINRIMSSHTYSTMILPCKNGRIVHSRKPGEPEEAHKKIYDLLSIDYAKLPKTKVVY